MLQLGATKTDKYLEQTYWSYSGEELLHDSYWWAKGIGIFKYNITVKKINFSTMHFKVNQVEMDIASDLINMELMIGFAMKKAWFYVKYQSK